jgi:hypothetical protein
MHTATLQVASCKAAALAARAAAAAGPPDEAPPAAPKARENDELHLGFLFYTRVLGRAVFFRLFFLLFFACKFTWRVLAGPPRGGEGGCSAPGWGRAPPPLPYPPPPNNRHIRKITTEGNYNMALFAKCLVRCVLDCSCPLSPAEEPFFGLRRLGVARPGRRAAVGVAKCSPDDMPASSEVLNNSYLRRTAQT